MGYDVFISFAFEDQQVAENICTYLKENNLSCFMCTDLPGGADFGIQIGEAIRQSRIFLLVFSAHADDSESVRSEANIAKMHNKIRMPLRIENRMPNKLAYLLGTSLFFDAFPLPVEAYLTKLATDIRRHLGITSNPIPREELNNVLRSPNYTPSKLIQFFKRDFGKEFASDAGVSQGYTVEEHTMMVLGQFEKYFSQQRLPAGFNTDTFRVILALHDIGVPVAIEEGAKHGKNPREAKQEQHKYTTKLMQRVLTRLEFDKREINVALAIILGDPIGQYLRKHGVKKISGEEASERIKRMARESGLPVLEFFELLLIFYMVDASSYTRDAGGPKALDDLFVFDRHKMRMKLAPSTSAKVDQLRIALEGREGVKWLSDYHWHDIDFAYLKDWVKKKRAELDAGEELKGKTFRYRRDPRRRVYQVRLRHKHNEHIYTPHIET